MALDVQTQSTPQPFQNVPSDPVEQFLNLEELQMTEGAIYESMAQPEDIVNEYDGPVCGSCRFRVETGVDFPQLFDDWNAFAYTPSCEPGSEIPESQHDASIPIYYLPSGVYPVEYSALDGDISVTIGESAFQPPTEYPVTVTPDLYEGTSDSPSPSSARSSPLPETPAFDNFRSDLPHIVSTSTAVCDIVGHEEQEMDKVAEVIAPTYSISLASVAALSPLSECESLPSSRSSSVSPSPESSERDSTSPCPSEESFRPPVRVVRKNRRARAGAIRKKKTKSKEKHYCCYCSESFTRDHDAERHQRTCKANPNCSQKEQCKVCAKPLPVRLDARRRHWGTLECSDAGRKLGFTRMDEETYELI
jgi:hypothetical protein